MSYVVSFRTNRQWHTWRLPVPTLEDALALVREIMNNNIDEYPWVDVRISRKKG